MSVDVQGVTGSSPVSVSYTHLDVYKRQVPLIPLHGTGKGAEHRVVFYLIDHVVQIRVPKVDAPDIVAAAATLHHAAQGHPPNPAEAVDAYFDRHAVPPLLYKFSGKVAPAGSQHIIAC